jgi:hypothetical protein
MFILTFLRVVREVFVEAAELRRNLRHRYPQAFAEE